MEGSRERNGWGCRGDQLASSGPPPRPLGRTFWGLRPTDLGLGNSVWTRLPTLAPGPTLFLLARLNLGLMQSGLGFGRIWDCLGRCFVRILAGLVRTLFFFAIEIGAGFWSTLWVGLGRCWSWVRPKCCRLGPNSLRRTPQCCSIPAHRFGWHCRHLPRFGQTRGGIGQTWPSLGLGFHQRWSDFDRLGPELQQGCADSTGAARRAALSGRAMILGKEA